MRRINKTGLWPEFPPGMTVIKYWRYEKYTVQIKVFSLDQSINRTFTVDRDTYLDRLDDAIEAHGEIREDYFGVYRYPEWPVVLRRLELKEEVVREPKYFYYDK